MIEQLKKALLAGVGLTLLTTDKVEEVARELAKNFDLSAEKGQAFVDEAVARAKKGRSDVEALVQRLVDQGVARAKLATRDELAQLTARIEELERQLAAKS